MSKPNPPSRPRRKWSSAPARLPPGLDLLPVVEQLAADTWLVAQKSPALPADPALVETATRLLRRLYGTLHDAPGFALLPKTFAPGIQLHALALALRQVHAGLAALARRYQPRDSGDDLDAIMRLEALFLRDITVKAFEQRDIPLPADLRHLGKSRRGASTKKLIPASPPRP
jgi:hypothetical protein